MSARRALVTGSAGFVGRHLMVALERAGYDATGIDVSRPTGDARAFFAADSTRFDVVVHAAAHVGGRADIERRAAYIGAYNLQLDGALFEWVLRTRPRQVVYLSSSAVYPKRMQMHAMGTRLVEDDIDLTDPQLPDATYGWVKLTGERIVAELAGVDGSTVHVVRPFSGYGIDQNTDYPFGAFRRRTLEHADPFVIWGNGSQVRDWIHINDITAAIMALVASGAPGRTINLCTGRGTSMTELARMFIDAARRSTYAPSIITEPTAPAGVQYRVGSPTRMLDVYVPKITIEEGVRRACRR